MSVYKGHAGAGVGYLLMQDADVRAQQGLIRVPLQTGPLPWSWG